MWGCENIAKSDNVANIDIENLKNMLTPDVLNRVEQLRANEINKQKIKDKEDDEKVYMWFNQFWAGMKPIKTKLQRDNDIELIKENISTNLAAFYQTIEGKQCKKEAHVKRSQTMARQREQVRAVIIEKICTRCKVTKPPAGFGKKSDAKDGLQPYCRTCIGEVKKNKRVVLRT
jgi:hypothetical protein